jgi:hypothetical protein
MRAIGRNYNIRVLIMRVLFCHITQRAECAIGSIANPMQGENYSTPKTKQSKRQRVSKTTNYCLHVIRRFRFQVVVVFDDVFEYC